MLITGAWNEKRPPRRLGFCIFGAKFRTKFAQQLMQPAQTNRDLHKIAFIPLPHRAELTRGRSQQVQADHFERCATLPHGLHIGGSYADIVGEQQADEFRDV